MGERRLQKIFFDRTRSIPHREQVCSTWPSQSSAYWDLNPKGWMPTRSYPKGDAQCSNLAGQNFVSAGEPRDANWTCVNKYFKLDQCNRTPLFAFLALTTLFVTHSVMVICSHTKRARNATLIKARLSLTLLKSIYVQSCWRRPGEEFLPRNVQKVVKHGRRIVMVWGCISWNEMGQLYCVIGYGCSSILQNSLQIISSSQSGGLWEDDYCLDS